MPKIKQGSTPFAMAKARALKRLHPTPEEQKRGRGSPHLSQLIVHGVDLSRVDPVAVVHGREGDPDLVHFDGRHHHVRRVQRVDEVGREGRGLPLDGDGEVVVLLSDMHALQKSLDLVQCKRRRSNRTTSNK